MPGSLRRRMTAAPELTPPTAEPSTATTGPPALPGWSGMVIWRKAVSVSGPLTALNEPSENLGAASAVVAGGEPQGETEAAGAGGPRRRRGREWRAGRSGSGGARCGEGGVEGRKMAGGRAACQAGRSGLAAGAGDRHRARAVDDVQRSEQDAVRAHEEGRALAHARWPWRRRPLHLWGGRRRRGR